MFPSPIFHPLTSPLLIAFLAAALWATPLNAQDYKKGDVIEYKVGGSVPTRWERGVVIRPLDGGRQYLIHEKPSEFFPDGPEVAYAPADLRPPAAVKKPDPDPKVKPADPIPGTRPTDPLPPPGTKVMGKGLLSEEDVLAYAKKVFGPGDPFRVPNRDALLDQIRDYIKARGTNFVANSDGEFYKKIVAQGTHAVRIIDSINANHGPAPKLDDYYKTFLMRVANRGSKSVTKQGTKVVITTTDL